MNKGKIFTSFYKTDFVYKTEFLRIFHIADRTLDKRVSDGRITCETDRHGRKWYFVKGGDIIGLRRRCPPATIKQKKKFKDIMSSPTKPSEDVVPYQPTEIVVSNLSHKEMKILSTRLTRLMAENKTLALKVEYLEKSLSIWKEVG
jgi:hypothetical protein